MPAYSIRRVSHYRNEKKAISKFITFFYQVEENLSPCYARESYPVEGTLVLEGYHMTERSDRSCLEMAVITWSMIAD